PERLAGESFANYRDRRVESKRRAQQTRLFWPVNGGSVVVSADRLARRRAVAIIGIRQYKRLGGASGARG
ncbi:MAG: hypothetical protein V4738_14290, partial [Pseudomonadota bacterium]